MIDPLGLFVFAKRPLGNSSSGYHSFNFPGADYLNLEGAHEHGFFEDGSGENVGFGPKGRFPEKDPANEPYTYDTKHYDDDIMRDALKNLKDGDYSLIGNMYQLKNNCQDWADRLRKEYERLAKKKNKTPCP